jgi:hypothetical protein
MIGRLVYSMKIGLLLAVLGGLVFFIWRMIGNKLLFSAVLNSSLMAILAFGVIGFILGLLIYGLEP